MRVHHLNCGTMCPFFERLVDGRGALFGPGKLVCHCLLIESADGLVLVDTGVGLGDVEHGGRRLGPLVPVLQARLDPAETALRRVEALGFRGSDVRHIVLTHLDLDHAGGLSDFPHARVHVLREERAAAEAPSLRERLRYRAAQWAHRPRWSTYDVDAGGERWFGFEAVRELEGLPPEILMIPLRGHTRGHAGVAVATEDGWLLHAGDAYFHRGVIDPVKPYYTPGLFLFERAAQTDRRARAENLTRLRALARDHRDDVKVFCAHDAVELEERVAAAEARRGMHAPNASAIRA